MKSFCGGGVHENEVMHAGAPKLISRQQTGSHRNGSDKQTVQTACAGNGACRNRVREQRGIFIIEALVLFTLSRQAVLQKRNIKARV